MIIAIAHTRYGTHPVQILDVHPGAGDHKQVYVQSLDGEPFVTNTREAKPTAWAVVQEDSLTDIGVVVEGGPVLSYHDAAHSD